MKWEVKKIKDLGIIQTGTTPNTSDVENVGDYISFVKPADFLPNGKLNYSSQKISEIGLQKTRLIKSNSVLMVCIGATIGKVGFSTLNVTTNQQINSLTPDSFYDAKFIYYQMLTRDFQRKVKQNASQATLPIINKTKWGNLIIKVPPLEEQKRVVEILDESFEAIALAEANTKKNLANARELFDSYLNKIFTEKGDDWVEEKLGDISENLDSQRIPITKSHRKIGKTPYYGASGIVDYVEGFIFDEDLLLVSEDGANLLARTYPIAFSISGKTWVNNHAHILRFEDISLQKFIEYFLNSISLKPFVSGMAQPKLNQRALHSIKVPFAPKPTRENIIKKLDLLSADSKKLEAIYQRKIEALSELKQSILQKAFTGQLTQ